MTEFALNLLTSAALSLVLSGFVVWLTKAWISERLKNAIKHEYDEKLESHKAQLKAQADVETEKLKASLSVSAAEHQVKFSGLHAKRADVIAEVYRLLVDAHWATASFASPFEIAGEPTKHEKYAAALGAMSTFSQYFDRHRIYLPEHLCLQLESLTKEMRSKAVAFGVRLRHNDFDLEGTATKRKHDAWDAAWDYFEKEFPVARAALEKELRGLLGDAHTSAH
jgi:hypothetical protein